MRDWSIQKLNEVSKIVNGGTPKTKVSDYWDGDINWITPKDLGQLESIYASDTPRTITELGLKKSSAKEIPSNSVILSTRAPIGHLAINTLSMAFNQGCRGIVPNENLDTKYLYYFLYKSIDLLNKLGTGATFKELSARALKSIEIPIPPLPEQKRIVAILDEAFEAIDQAKANIERNIENAEELFQSKLNEIFSQRGKGWVTEKLSNVFRMKSGDQLSKKNVIPGPYPVYGGNGITAHHKEYNLEGQQVLIGRVGAQCGNVHLTDEKIWLTDNAFRVTDLKYEFDFEFLEHLLRVKDLRQTARQSAQPVISNSSCKNVQLDFPESITQQKEIAELVNALDSEVLQIIEVYKTKLLALEELKKSILQKAFSGELTVNEHVAA